MKLKLFFLLLISFSMHAARVIIIMGPSCAGKSTLAHCLCIKLNALHEQWQHVDFDDVGEDLEQLIETTNNYLQQNVNVIIDTNTYEDQMEKKFDSADVIKVIVTAPLDVLLQRDARRTQRLQRNEQRVLLARNFVIHSFNESALWLSDLVIDSSQQSVQESYEIIMNFLKIKSFLIN